MSELDCAELGSRDRNLITIFYWNEIFWLVFWFGHRVNCPILESRGWMEVRLEQNDRCCTGAACNKGINCDGNGTDLMRFSMIPIFETRGWRVIRPLLFTIGYLICMLWARFFSMGIGYMTSFGEGSRITLPDIPSVNRTAVTEACPIFRRVLSLTGYLKL